MGLDQGTEINGATLNEEFVTILWQAAGEESHAAPPFALLPEATSGAEEAIVPGEDEWVVPSNWPEGQVS